MRKDRVSRMIIGCYRAATYLVLLSCVWFCVLRPANGFYVETFDLLYCRGPLSCLHEQAHRMDAYAGRGSETQEFKTALQEFVSLHPDHPWTSVIKNYKHNHHEMYAQIWEAARGDIRRIPVELREFYEWPETHYLPGGLESLQ